MLVPALANALILIKHRLDSGTAHAAKLGGMMQANMSKAPIDRLTIGRLAKAAEVGIETVRYYQRRGLLPVPRAAGAVRYYATSQVRRIGFIKKAQALGFSLNEIATLLDLADGRNRWAVQAVTSARLAEIETKLTDLTRMQAALSELLHQCRATGKAHPCPIIEALAAPAAAD